MFSSLRTVLGFSTCVVMACSHQWTGPTPGYSESRANRDASHASAAVANTSAASTKRASAPAQALTSGAPADPPPDTTTQTADDPTAPLFPDGTRSLKVREQAHVRGEPRDDAPYIGKITRGTRVAWKRVVTASLDDPEAGTDGDAPARRRRRAPCPSWVEIEPQGWLCSTLFDASEAEPSGERLPIVPRGKLTPHDYFRVSTDETMVFETADDVRAGVLKKVLSTKVMVVGTSLLNVDGTDYRKTDHGLIESAALARFWPSDFVGIDLREHPRATWPFAWVHAIRGGRAPDILSEPDAKSERVRRAVRREIVSVLEEQDGFVRIADGEWIERKHLRVAALASPPEGIGPTGQWIDVNLAEQVLVAYEGEKPVFATLVSTGKQRHPTPAGTYRVRAKAATTTMADDPRIPNRYEVSAVPWAVRFRDGLFIHAAYWHDAFGGVVSHGCVNVSPKDAAFIYDWVGPQMPDGWSEIEVRQNGAIVRVRNDENPNPPVFDYAAEDQPR